MPGIKKQPGVEKTLDPLQRWHYIPLAYCCFQWKHFLQWWNLVVTAERALRFLVGVLMVVNSEFQLFIETFSARMFCIYATLQYVIIPQLQRTCRYRANVYVIILHVLLGCANSLHPISKICSKFIRHARIYSNCRIGVFHDFYCNQFVFDV